MTAVRPEGRPDAGQGYGAAEPDGWGVYDPAGVSDQPADRTLQLRAMSDVPTAGVPMPGGTVTGVPVEGESPTGGRAERRRAANRNARSAGRGTPVPRPKESIGVRAARLAGELCITLGVVMLLFVAYQLWWTNVQANASAAGTRNQLEQQWGAGAATPAPGQSPAKDPGVFAPGQGFAILYVPKLGLQYPIAEGTDKQKVLDHGLVGHYAGTAMPADPSGNFAVAAHRTTHGQPFRKIGQLVPGDKIVVETATEYYTYEVAGGIAETPPTNVTVLQAVPKGSPFGQAGRYITMTTCTPEFSARGRLIVFGKMVEERPRSQGQPPALTS